MRPRESGISVGINNPWFVLHTRIHISPFFLSLHGFRNWIGLKVRFCTEIDVFLLFFSYLSLERIAARLEFAEKNIWEDDKRMK